MRLKAHAPHLFFSFVIGADLVAGLNTWKFASKLIADVSFLVLPRVGYSIPTTGPSIPAHVRLLVVGEAFSFDISSTLLRERCKRVTGEGDVLAVIEGLCSLSMLSYMKHHALYR